MEIFKYIATSIAPILSTILITIAYFPQIAKTYKTKSVDDLSLGFWLILAGFLISTIINAAYLAMTASGIGYLITQLVNFAFALVIIFQILYYKKKNNK